MTNAFIQVPPDSTGKRLFAQQYTVDALPVQIPVMHVADHNNPMHFQHVDNRGQASVRFAEGSPSMSAFGELRTSTGKMIGVYDFTTDSADELFSDIQTGGGALTYLPAASTVSLSVTSAIGSYSGRCSDKYHFYWPGAGNLSLMTIALSDSGMTGCSRRWGTFDYNDGLYFNLDESGVLNIVKQSSTSGAVVVTKFPQSTWNGDKVDGAGESGFTLDLTKMNIYWIDFQWLGAGFSRFGVVDSQGNRVTCHTIENANYNIYPYMRAGSLPIAFDIQNITATGGAASIRMTCASVKTEGEINYTYWRYAYSFGAPVGAEGVNIPLITLKSVNTWNGKHNGTTAFPELLTCYVNGGVVKVDLYWDLMTHTGATYALDNGSTVIADIAATATSITTQTVMRTFYLDAGTHSIDLTPFFETNDVAINARSDESTPLQIAFVATTVAGTPVIDGAINYRELR